VSNFVDILSPEAARKAGRQRRPSMMRTAVPAAPSLAGGAAEGAVENGLGYVNADDEATVAQVLMEMSARSVESPGGWAGRRALGRAAQ
jgi:hypothetical protein